MLTFNLKFMRQLVLLVVFFGMSAGITAQTNADESMNLAIDFNKKKDYKTSSIYCISALKFDSNHTNAHFLLGYNQYLLENYKDAVSEFSKTITLNPNHIDAWYYRAKSKQALKDFVGAFSDFNKARELNPGHTMFFMVRSWLSSLFSGADNK